MNRNDPLYRACVNFCKAAPSKSAEGRFMKTKLTALVLGTLVAGSLGLSARPALARDGDWRNDRDYRRPSARVVVPVSPADRYRHRDWGYPVARVPVPVYRPVPVPSYGYPAYGYPAGAAYGQEDLYRRLDHAIRKRNYDRAHGASREQIADDNAHIARLQRQLGMR